MKKVLLLGVASALLITPAFAQTPSTSDFVNKVAQSDMLEIQSSQFVAPNADADTHPCADTGSDARSHAGPDTSANTEPDSRADAQTAVRDQVGWRAGQQIKEQRQRRPLLADNGHGNRWLHHQWCGRLGLLPVGAGRQPGYADHRGFWHDSGGGR